MHTIYSKKFLALIALSSLLTLTACGGGGGSSNGGGSTPTYTGSRSTASLTTSNAPTFVSLAESAYDINGISGGLLRNAEQTANENKLPAKTVLLNIVSDQVKQNRYQARTINLSKPCLLSGTLTTTGELNDTSNTGTLSLTFNNCAEAEGTLNGTVSANVTGYSLIYDEITAMTVSINSLSFTSAGQSMTLTGTQQITRAIPSSASTVISNLLSIYSDGIQILEEGLTVAQNNNGESTFTGKICHSTQGCVTLTTLQSFTFIYDYPYTGVLTLNGLNSKIKIDFTYGEIRLDSDGDNIFESLIGYITAA